jgi:Protein of unknown function (DUF2442)
MPQETNAPQNHPPLITPLSAWRIAALEILPEFTLKLRFNDGLEGKVYLKPLIFSKDAGVFTTLKNETTFNSAKLSLGVVTWNDNIDIAPDTLYDNIKSNGEWTPS